MLARIGIIFSLFLLLLLASCQPEQPAANSDTPKNAEQIAAALKYESGTISLLAGEITLQVPDKFRWLQADQARLVLHQLWRNLPDEREQLLGLLFPPYQSPASDSLDYAVKFSWQAEGYLPEDRLGSLDPALLLQKLQSQLELDNQLRQQQGARPVKLVDWAVKPVYHRRYQVLYWALALRFGESAPVLNYHLCFLGRKGVLHLQIFSPLLYLPKVQSDLELISQSVFFNPGFRYIDFSQGDDPLSSKDLNALVLGQNEPPLWQTLPRTFTLALAAALLVYLLWLLIARLRQRKKRKKF